MITPQQLHEWYLEATKSLHPESYNPNAQKSYEELTDEQRKIDEYMAEKINDYIQKYEKLIEGLLPYIRDEQYDK